MHIDSEERDFPQIWYSMCTFRKKRRQDFRLKKIQNGHQNGSQNQFFDNILLGTNLREKYQEYKNEQQEKCFKCVYRTPAMLHRFSTKGHFM